MSCFILRLEQFSGLHARGFVGTVEGGGEEIREVIVCTGISVAHLDELSLSSGRNTATPTELDGWNFLSGGVRSGVLFLLALPGSLSLRLSRLLVPVTLGPAAGTDPWAARDMALVLLAVCLALCLTYGTGFLCFRGHMCVCACEMVSAFGR